MPFWLNYTALGLRQCVAENAAARRAATHHITRALPLALLAANGAGAAITCARTITADVPCNCGDLPQRIKTSAATCHA
jgi:hypothetical protein